MLWARVLHQLGDAIRLDEVGDPGLKVSPDNVEIVLCTRQVTVELAFNQLVELNSANEAEREQHNRQAQEERHEAKPNQPESERVIPGVEQLRERAGTLARRSHMTVGLHEMPLLLFD